jgi:tripartite-type tricarboxylate transporter receptor subunit TctC
MRRRSPLRRRPQIRTLDSYHRIQQLLSLGWEPMDKSDSDAPLSRRRFIKSSIAIAVTAIAAPYVLRISPAFAAYPDRTVKIVVANTPGGPSDIIARIMAAALQEQLGGTVIVENRGGAGSNLGMGYVARSDPDGYTLLLSTSAYSVNPSLYQSIPYDPFKDFAAICELATSPNVFAVKPERGIKTMKELVALAKANPEKFNISTPPIGTTPQLEAEVLKAREGLSTMATIVFAGGGEALKALLGDTVQISSGTLAPAHPYIKSGALTGLAVTGATRWHDLPEVPTMAEAGYNDFVFETYTALMAPAKTPPEIVAQLEKTSLDILHRADMTQRLLQQGFEVQAKDGKAHMARVAREVAMFREIIAQAGIKQM